MAYLKYLTIDGTDLPLPNSYELDLSSVTLDTYGETEAGTKQRDIVRRGVVSISVSFSLSAFWLKKMSIYSKKDKLRVLYFDTESLEQKETEMYISDFKAKLEKDTSKKGLWMVSFTLNEF